jgi:subtilase family protein/type IX secretion system substrate protein
MRNNRLLILFSFLSIILMSNIALGQVVTNTEALLKFSREKAAEYKERRAQAEKYADEHNLPVTFVNDKGVFFELQYINEDGTPMYYKTDNSNAAKTISTNKVYSGGGAGLSLDGSGITAREWDGGGILVGHQEFGGRVTQGDSPSSTLWHATHVAGTIMAAGVQSAAKGMAYNANLRAFDWNSDNSEMASEAAQGALVSNHSYGFGRGWSWTGSGWSWAGNSGVSTQEDYLFGFYDNESRGWDQIASDAPYYLIVKSSGNDRNEGPNGGSHPKDGPYDCIAHGGISKNVLTVGAVHDIAAGYNGPGTVNMSSFSSWGPADDGRVKPDIVANGVGLYSTNDSHNSSYTSSDGTSMSAPSATGSLVLLQEHWEELVGNGEYMRAATLKGLVIHTADEAGIQDGPDYQFGWGLMNTKNAALKITEDQSINVIDEIILNEGNTFEMVLVSDGSEDLKVTICWTDLPGQPLSPQLDPTNPMLINDLDLRVTFDGNNYFPWKLNPVSPASIATNNSKNYVDNVEVVFIENPDAGEYTVVVSHDGSLSEGNQAFSIIIGGVTNTISLPSASAGEDTDVCENGEAQLNGFATYYSSIEWSTSGDGTFNDNSVVDAIYTPGTEDIIAGTVDLELTVNAQPPATGFVSDDVTINIVNAPTANAGEDITICGSGSAQLDGLAENYESVIWASRGDGEFDDNTLLNAIYTPGPNDIVEGQIKLSLLANAIEPCTDEFKDEMFVNIGVAPKPNAGPDGITCGNMSYQLDGSAEDNTGILWSTLGDGDFDDSSLLNANYTPGGNDILAGSVELMFTAQATPPCTNDSTDTMILVIEGMPDINAGEDAISCAGNEFILSGVVDNPASIEWTTSGDGVFTNNAVLETTYTPGSGDNETGNVNLKLTANFDEGCETGFDELLLELLPDAISNAGSNDSVCKDGSITMSGQAENYTDIEWSSLGDGTFTNSTILNPDYTPGTSDISSGSVILQLSAYPEAPCNEVITTDMTLLILDCDAIAEYSANSLGFRVIPNPANNVFVISTDNTVSGDVEIKIFGLDNKIVYSNKFNTNNSVFNTTINIESLTSGIYTVLVNTESKAGIRKLVIQR